MPDDMGRLRAAFREIYPDDIADAICEWIEATLALGEGLPSASRSDTVEPPDDES